MLEDGVVGLMVSMHVWKDVKTEKIGGHVEKKWSKKIMVNIWLMQLVGQYWEIYLYGQ